MSKHVVINLGSLRGTNTGDTVTGILPAGFAPGAVIGSIRAFGTSYPVTVTYFPTTVTFVWPAPAVTHSSNILLQLEAVGDDFEVNLALHRISADRRIGSFALSGDSRNQQQSFNNFLALPAKHFFNRANQMLGHRMDMVLNTAVSGTSSDVNMTQTTVNQIIASPAAWCIYFGVFNDLAASRTAQQIWDGYNGAIGLRSAFNQLMAAGIRLVLVLEPGGSVISGVAGAVAEANKHNSRIRALQMINPSIVIFDLPSISVDPTSATIALKASHTLDSTHFTNIAGDAQGAVFAAQMGPFLPARDNLPWSRQQIFSNGGVYFVNNPLFTTLAGGAVAGAGTITGGTGTVPFGYKASADAGITLAITSAAGAFGNDLTLTASSTAAGAFSLSYDIFGEQAGDVLETVFEADLAGAPVNFEGLYSFFQVNYAPTAYNLYDGYAAPGEPVAASIARAGLRYQTPPVIIPNGSKNWCTSWISGRFNATGGSMAATIRRHSVQKLTPY